jgi:hypothetical protein
MDESSNIQNRRSNRSPVLLSAKVEVNGAQVPVILRNLSSQGALIEGRELPLEGTTTKFHRKELTVEGKIVWVEGRYAGMSFDRALAPDELLQHVPKPRQRVESQFRRPGLTCAPLSEADRKMVQMWMSPISLQK